MITPAVPDPPEVTELLWRGYSHSDLAFDIGANCGQTLGHILNFSDKVIAFEPSWESADWIVDHLSPDMPVQVKKIAISSITGWITLYAVPEKISTGQLVSDVRGMEWEVPGESFGRPVPAYTLDDAVKDFGAPGFIKIDVEGHEWEILRDTVYTLESVRPEFLIEIHDRQFGYEIFDLLMTYDYNMEVVRHPHYDINSDMYLTHYWIKAFPDIY